MAGQNPPPIAKKPKVGNPPPATPPINSAGKIGAGRVP